MRMPCPTCGKSDCRIHLLKFYPDDAIAAAERRVTLEAMIAEKYGLETDRERAAWHRGRWCGVTDGLIAGALVGFTFSILFFHFVVR